MNTLQHFKDYMNNVENNLNLDDYKKEKLTISIVWANIFGVLSLIPIAIIYGLPYYLIWNTKTNDGSFFTNISKGDYSFNVTTVLLIIFWGVIAHEFLHGFVWSRFASKGFKSIKFGILLKLLTPYCHCKEPLKVKHYIYGSIAPLIVLGIIPTVIAITFGYLAFLEFGIFFTLVAAGDIMVINLLLKEDMESLVQDHPSEAGCYIYRKT